MYQSRLYSVDYEDRQKSFLKSLHGSSISTAHEEGISKIQHGQSIASLNIIGPTMFSCYRFFVSQGIRDIFKGPCSTRVGIRLSPRRAA